LKTADFTYLIHKPDALTEKQTSDLERVLSEFPYFQTAAAIHLKGLYNQNNYRYNSQLKKIASQTTSRTALYDLITKDNFLDQKNLYDIEVIEPEIVFSKTASTEEKREQSILFSIEASQIKNIESQEKNIVEKNKSDEKLEQSILFSIDTSGIKNITTNQEISAKQSEEEEVKKISETEKFSFTQWLHLAQKQRIYAENNTKITPQKQKKMDIIDKFIETNPKIIPRQTAPIKFVLDEKSSENTILMTETLAELYLKQKKYKKAIEAYEILILKYPQKSSFFANQINYIKKIQQDNI